MLLRLRGSSAAFLFGFAKLVQQLTNLGDLAGGAADEQAARRQVSIDTRCLRIRLFIVAAEELVDRDDRNLRIDVRQGDDIDLLRFLLHLVDRGANRGLLRRRGERNDFSTLFIGRQDHVRVVVQQRLQHLHNHVWIGGCDRIDFQLRCTVDAAGRLGHIDQSQNLRQPGRLLGCAAEDHLFAVRAFGDLNGAVRRAERLGRNAEHLANRRHGRVERDVLERKLPHPGRAGFGLFDRVHDRADRPQPPAGLGHLNLAGLRQRNGFALRPQQRLHFQRGLLGRHVPHRKQHADQLILAALVEFGQRHIGHQIRRNAVFKIHDNQHPPMADERVAFGQQHAVEHIERFGRRVGSRIGVVERARRRRLHQQRQAGLLGEPIQDILPRLVAEAESQLGVGRRNSRG